MKYLISSEQDNTLPLDSYEATLNEWKSKMLEEGVSLGEYIEVHAFDDSVGETEDESRLYRRFEVIEDVNRMKINTPSGEGHDYEPWATWEEVEVSFNPLFKSDGDRLIQIVKHEDKVYATQNTQGITMGKQYKVLNVYLGSIVVQNDNLDAFAYEHGYFTL